MTHKTRNEYDYAIMTKSTIRSLKEEAEQIRKEIGGIESALTGLADGKLYIQKKPDGKIYYRRCFINDKDERCIQYLPKNNIKMRRQLAERTYCSELLPVLKNELNALGSALSVLELDEKTQVWARLDPKVRDLVEPRYMTPDESDKAWNEEKYERNENYPERLLIKTLKGEMVRSKTEALIADLLFHAGISYRYESALFISDYSTFYPDFTIRRKSDGKIFYWEHFGLLDDPDYLDSTIYKLNKYSKNGITLGDNLLITWETSAHPFDRTTAEKYIGLLVL